MKSGWTSWVRTAAAGLALGLGVSRTERRGGRAPKRAKATIGRKPRSQLRRNETQGITPSLLRGAMLAAVCLAAFCPGPNTLAITLDPFGIGYYEIVDGLRWTFALKSSEAGDYIKLGLHAEAEPGISNYNAIYPGPGYATADSTIVRWAEAQGNITIPSSFSGIPVKEIGPWAFSYCSKITSVTIPYGVIVISKGAFGGCTGLQSVTIPDSVTRIGGLAFSGCTRLTTLTIPESVISLGTNPGAFSNSNLRTLYVPASWQGKLSGTQVPTNCQVIYYTPGAQTVTFNANGGNCATSTKTYSLDGNYSNLPTTTWSGYTFDGWYTATDAGTKITEGKAVSTNWFLTLYAHWLANMYSVTLDRQGGSGGTTSVSATTGTAMPDIAVPTCTGYSFAGYYTAANGKGTKYYTQEGKSARAWGEGTDSTLYAKWTANSYTVSFDLQGGEGGAGSATATYGSPMPPIVVPTRTGHAFGGYYSAKNGGGTQYYAATGESMRAWDKAFATTLYAKWTSTTLSITPPTRNFGTGGGAYAIVTSGSGTWNAETSETWITLNASSGQAGYPVAYVVGATTQAESRTGHVFVSGHVHTVTQDGQGGSISPTNTTFEMVGGTGSIAVTVNDGIAWQVIANCDWVNLSPESGVGPGSVTFTVAPLNEIITRQGGLTVAGQTFNVVQNGLPMAISPVAETYDYCSHAISIMVEALAITKWSVKPSASWISLVNSGNGQGSGTVTLEIEENPSWKARTGTVEIGTETFTLTQEGRTALEFVISPETVTVGAEASDGSIAVTATPDLPWSTKSQAVWLTLNTQTASGAGNGAVSYSVAANPTLDARTGQITVTPGDSRVDAKTITVTQRAASSSLSSTNHEFAALGGSCEVSVSVPDIVEWQIQNTNAWLTVSGAANRMGPGTVTLQAATNNTVQPRSGTVTIAKKLFVVTQTARGVEVEYDTKWFGKDGGSDSLPIRADESVSWTAVASDPTWITIWQGGSGTGNGEVMYIVSPYVGDGNGRTGSIAVGDQMVRIVQRTQMFPEVQDAAGVAVALGASTDKRLGERISTVAEYDGFRAWMAEKGLDEQAVIASPHAWPSYALGAESLFTNEPTIQIDGMSVGDARTRGEGNGMAMAVSVTVRDGDKTVTVDAAKISTMFETTGNLLDWDGEDKLSAIATLTGCDGATMHYEVVPDDGTADTAFLRFVLSQGKMVQTIDFEPVGAQMTTNRVKLSATASSGGTVTFKVVSGPGVVEGNVLSFTGAGTVVVRAVQAGGSRWLPASEIQTVTVGKAAQTITFPAIGARTWQEPVALSATASGGGAVTFEVVSGPGTVQGNELSFTGAGTVVVRAVQAGDARWLPASEIQTVTVGKAAQTITFPAIGDRTWQEPVALSATASGGGAVTFEVVSGPGQIVENVLSFTGPGTVEVRAVQTGDERWIPADVTQTVSVTKAAQILSFSVIGERTWKDQVILSATVSSSGAMTFEVVSGPGQIRGNNLLSFSAIGTVEVRAIQAGDELWLPATATQTVSVKPALAIAGALSIRMGESTTYACVEVYPDGTRVPVLPEWSLADADEFMDITPEGVLTTVSMSGQIGHSIKVQAVFEGRMATQFVFVSLNVEEIGDTVATWPLQWNMTGETEYSTLLSAGVTEYSTLLSVGNFSVPVSLMTNAMISNKGLYSPGWAFPGPNDDAYYELSITPIGNQALNLGVLSFSIRSSKAGPPSAEIRWAVDDAWMPGVTLAFTNDLLEYPHEIDFSDTTVLPGQTFRFRIYAWGAPASGGTFRVNASQPPTLTGKFVDAPANSAAKAYMVVDLSAGSGEDAVYPVSFLKEIPKGGWTDEYKTSKLVMKRIDPGTFMMCGEYQTTLTKPYYMGVFEVTQRQYELVTGSKPSYYKGNARPVEGVSWNTIRGNTDWPASSAVSADSFMGRIRARTRLGDFDLPTEAQWDYACRAGTTTAYSYGDSADGDFMWYSDNSSWETHDVGTKIPNAWGLYDMHGNVWEWCLDWYASSVGMTTVIDPKGASSGSDRAKRGGDWMGGAENCHSAYRFYNDPAYSYSGLGFRLSRDLAE